MWLLDSTMWNLNQIIRTLTVSLSFLSTSTAWFQKQFSQMWALVIDRLKDYPVCVLWFRTLILSWVTTTEITRRQILFSKGTNAFLTHYEQILNFIHLNIKGHGSQQRQSNMSPGSLFPCYFLDLLKQMKVQFVTEWTQPKNSGAEHAY